MKIGNVLKGGVVVGVVILILIGVIGFQSIVEFVDNDEYAIHQSAIKGKLTVWNEPGLHGQFFGKVVKYKKQSDIFLSSDKLDGGDGDDVQAVKVQFPDGHAFVDMATRYKLSLSENDQLELYKNIGNEIAVQSMVRQQILEAISQVGPLMSSAFAYADRRPEIAILARRQALEGIFAAEVTTDTTGIDRDKKPILVKRYDVKYKNNKPVITKESVLKTYKITFPQFNVKGMVFDDKTIDLIESKKDAKRAKQSAITAYEEGQALVAKERATQEAIKVKEVTIAEKLKEVGILKAEQRQEVATLAAQEAAQKKIAAILLAEAKEKELKISDGLSDRERYAIDKKTEAIIKSAEHFAKWKGPEVVVSGSGGKGGSGLGDVLMLERYMEMVGKMNNTNTKSK